MRLLTIVIAYYYFFFLLILCRALWSWSLDFRRKGICDNNDLPPKIRVVTHELMIPTGACTQNTFYDWIQPPRYTKPHYFLLYIITYNSITLCKNLFNIKSEFVFLFENCFYDVVTLSNYVVLIFVYCVFSTHSVFLFLTLRPMNRIR